VEHVILFETEDRPIGELNCRPCLQEENGKFLKILRPIMGYGVKVLEAEWFYLKPAQNLSYI
jgi:hypothetical protein